MTDYHLDDEAFARAMITVYLRVILVTTMATGALAAAAAHVAGFSGGLVIASVILWILMTRAVVSTYPADEVYDLYMSYEEGNARDDR